MLPRGLQPHSHEERGAIIAQLVPLWQQKFGDNMLAIAASASYARGSDQAYSDLELVVFLRDPVPPDEDQYLQRIVDGMLIEAAYVTEETYLEEHRTLSGAWYLAASETLVPIYNPAFITAIVHQLHSIRHSPEQFVRQAARRFLDVQESCGKVLNAIGQDNREGLPLLLFDALLHMLVTLSFLNQQPFTTFATFMSQARQFTQKPEKFDELLDMIVAGDYSDLARLREMVLTIFQGFEYLFIGRGFELYDTTIDPNIANKQYK
jgi:hypothetical protein